MFYGKERRMENSQLLEKINGIKEEVTLLNSEFKNWTIFHDRQAGERQEATCAKLNVIVEQIGTINKRCFDRTENHTLFKKHLEDEKRIASIWTNRHFQIMLGFITPVYIALVALFIDLLRRKLF